MPQEDVPVRGVRFGVVIIPHPVGEPRDVRDPVQRQRVVVIDQGELAARSARSSRTGVEGDDSRARNAVFDQLRRRPPLPVL
jgi:hypothetical protein